MTYDYTRFRSTVANDFMSRRSRLATVEAASLGTQRARTRLSRRILRLSPLGAPRRTVQRPSRRSRLRRVQ